MFCRTVVYCLLFLNGCSKPSTSVASAVPSASASSTTGAAATSDALADPIVQSIDDNYTIAALLETYTSVTLRQIYLDVGIVSRISFFKKDDSINCVQFWNNYEAFETYDYLLEYSGQAVQAILSAYSEPFFGVSKFAAVAMYDSTPTVTTDVYGNYIVSFSYLMDADMADIYDASEKDTLLTISKFECDTLQSLEGSTYIEHPDGTIDNTYLEYLVTYDTEVVYPAKIKELLGSTRHAITLHLSDGTDRTYDVPNEAVVLFLIPEDEAVYKDEACAEAYDNNSPTVFTFDTDFYCK